MLKKLKAFETKKIADFLLMMKDIKNKFYGRLKEQDLSGEWIVETSAKSLQKNNIN